MRTDLRVRSVVSFAGEPDQALAEVVAAVEAGDRPRRLIDTVEHVLKVAIEMVARSSVRTEDSAPPKRPIGVRTASQI